MSVKNGVSVKWSILIAIAMVLPMLISSDYYLIVFCQVLLNIVAVIGLNFISGLTGQTMLGMAGVVALGAYISGILSTLHLTLWACREEGCLPCIRLHTALPISSWFLRRFPP